jgi:plastocyanin
MRRCTGRALALAIALVLSPGLLAAGKEHRVTIEGMKFIPESLEVAPGDTIIWSNKDFVPHTVTAGKSIESGTIEANVSWKYVAKQKGRFDYLCRFHPGMRATLVVK